MVYSTSGFLFALAMDYDLFLFARVYERRMQGYDNASAVRIALEETGPLISLAGEPIGWWDFDENDGSEWIGHDAFHLVGSRIMPWMIFRIVFQLDKCFTMRGTIMVVSFFFVFLSTVPVIAQMGVALRWFIARVRFTRSDLSCICLDFLGLSFKYIIAILSVNDRVSFQALPSLQFTMFSYAHPPDVW